MAKRNMTGSKSENAQSKVEVGKGMIPRLNGQATRMKGYVDSRIQNNPEKSVLIAAGIGAVAGAAITAVILRRASA